MRKMLIVILLGLIAIGLIAGVVLFPAGGIGSSGRPASLASARRALEFGDFQEAIELSQQIAEQSDPTDVNATAEAWLVAGEAASKIEDFDSAIEYYGKVPASAADAKIARWATGEIHFFRKQALQAYQALQAALEADPRYLSAHERMIDVCNAVGLRRDGFTHTMSMIRAQRVRPDYLMLIGNVAKDTWTEESLQGILAASPNDPLAKLGLARIAVAKADFSQAEQLLGQVLLELPKLVEAHVQLGEIIAESNPAMFPTWDRQLPAQAQQNADIWYIKARVLRSVGKSKSALRCLAECIRLDPNHLPAHQSMAQMLPSFNEFEKANEFSDRAQKLQKLNIALERIYKTQNDTEIMQEIATLASQLGRAWECIGWSSIAQSINKNLNWPAPLVNEITQKYVITGATPHTLPDFNLVTQNPELFTRFSIPDITELAAEGVFPSVKSSGAVSNFANVGNTAFRDVATDVGIDFTFDSNTAANRDGRLIFEITGGGVGVFDYDLNGKPDIFFSQAGDFPPSPDSASHQDQLFQGIPSSNEFGIEFNKATQFAMLEDFSFGQGVSTADVNGDGFDDIIVCNIGPNQLWLNAGDGTFWNATSTIDALDAWTVSAAIADLDLNGTAEIYEVNYVEGDDVFTRTCSVGNKPRGCSPLEFQPAEDRILTPSDSGSFVALHSTGEMQGNGLGISAFKMDDNDMPSIFVAVDQEANLFGTVERNDSAASPEDAFTLANDSVLAGMAYDKAGSAQACMGIATGDANNDGAIDLYVTNFYLEYYTLYLQEAGIFRDASAASGTVASTNPLLGFGTQFLDANLDGNQDLFVLNGHIDDHTHIGVPEEMPPQFFLGDGTGRFALQPADGNYLSRLVLGRSLTTLDFDDDGRMDVACGDLQSPFSLVRNESTTAGKSITLRLVGTNSDRNAFFTIAKLTAGSYQQQLQLTAGSGYAASNERLLQFSIPASTLAESPAIEVEILWPSGTRETLTELQPGQSYLAIEAQGSYPLRKSL